MKIRKAVITAAGPSQRSLPLQTLVDTDGNTKPVLQVLIQEAASAGVTDIAVVVHPGDVEAYTAAAGREHDVTFLPQIGSAGYGYAILQAQDFVGGEAFLHLVGDHVYTNRSGKTCAQQLVETATEHECSVSGLQPTRESLLPYFGAIGGIRVAGTSRLYQVERVVEKPTPTEAEQTLLIPGLRAGHYLCFFGMHVLTPRVLTLLEKRTQETGSGNSRDFASVLSQLAGHERYLGLEISGRRFAIDRKYGLLGAQLGLALEGKDRDEVLSLITDLLIQRELSAS